MPCSYVWAVLFAKLNIWFIFTRELAGTFTVSSGLKWENTEKPLPSMAFLPIESKIK
jgi:hypothetical protein